MKVFTTVLACLGAVYSANTFAQMKSEKPVYVDLGYTMISYKEPGYNLSPTALRLVVGKNASDNFGVEGLFATSAGSDSVTANGVTADFKVSTMYGVYAKAFTKLNKDVELFGRLGFAHVTHQISSTVKKSVEDSGSGVSYGGGIKYAVNSNINVFADYMVYYPEKNGISDEGFTLGVGFNF